jgi:poly(ADP-ribose) glycohydrolase ARH3
MTRRNLEEKCLGSLVGSALGDAIGELAFQYAERAMLSEAIERYRELRYTDDTAMTIGLATSLIECGRIDAQRLGKTFSRNFQLEPWRGYAAGPPTVFSMVRSMKISYIEGARTLFNGTGSFGNGAAMRVAPLGLFFHGSKDLYTQASASAEVTHAHPLGKDGAAVQARAVAQAASLDSGKEFQLGAFTQGLVDFARTSEIREKMQLVQSLIGEDIQPKSAADQVGRSVAVHESMPFAVYSFLRHPDSFVECLFCAILNGGDRDTLGAMAGAISGAYLGIEVIPSTWRLKLENRPIIEKLAIDLAKASQVHQ